MEFNHPFSITNEIVCWDYASSKVGTTLEDSYDYIATIADELKVSDKPVGFVLKDIRLRSGLQSIGHEIRVISLKRLLAVTFKIDYRSATAK